MFMKEMVSIIVNWLKQKSPGGTSRRAFASLAFI